MPILNSIGALSLEEGGDNSGTPAITGFMIKVVPNYDGTVVLILRERNAEVYERDSSGIYNLALTFKHSDFVSDGDISSDGKRVIVSFKPASSGTYTSEVYEYRKTTVWEQYNSIIDSGAATNTQNNFGHSVSMSWSDSTYIIGQENSSQTVSSWYDGYVWYYGVGNAVKVKLPKTTLGTGNHIWPGRALLSDNGNYAKVGMRDGKTAAENWSISTKLQVTIPSTVKFHEMSCRDNVLYREYKPVIYSGDGNVKFDVYGANDSTGIPKLGNANSIYKVVITYGILPTVVTPPVIDTWDPTKVTPYIVELNVNAGDIISASISTKTAGSVTIDWGDGTSATTFTTNNDVSSISGFYNTTQFSQTSYVARQHTYSTSGTFRISIKSSTGYISVLSGSSDGLGASSLRRVVQWGTQRFYDMSLMFRSCTNLSSFPSSEIPDTSYCTNMALMFDYASNFNSVMNGWNVSKVKYFTGTFANASSFNKPLDKWNTDSAVDMVNMFANASVFNQDLSRWCVKNISIEPMHFADLTYTLPKPNWGTCLYPVTNPNTTTAIIDVTSPFINIETGTTVNLIVATSSGPIGVTPVYSISPALPVGLSFNTANATITGTVSTAAQAVNYTITVAYGALTDSDIINITISVPKLSIQIGAPTRQYYVNKLSADTTATATAINGTAPYSYSLILYSTGLVTTPPAGLVFNASTARISGTPTSTQVLTSYRVKVTDGVGATATTSDYFNILISIPPIEVVVNTTAYNFTVGKAVATTYPITAISGSGKTLTYSISPALPTGLTFNTSTGSFSGTPTATSTVTTYTITANDGVTNPGSGTFTITVAAASVVVKLPYIVRVRTTTSNETITIGLCTKTASSGTVVSWGDGKSSTVTTVAYVAGGLSVSPGQTWGSKVSSAITTSHTFAAAGAYDISISSGTKYLWASVGNSGDAGSTQSIIDVKQWGTSKFHVMSCMFRSNSELTTFSATDTPDLSECTNIDLAFDWAGKFNSDISGWKTGFISSMAGTFNNTTVFNKNLSGWCVSKIASIALAPPNTGGFITNFAEDSALTKANYPKWGTCPTGSGQVPVTGLSITSNGECSLSVGSAYSVQLATASGGTASYVYSISNLSALTAIGLSFSSAGVLSGTPSAVLSATTFTVTVTDSSGNKASVGVDVGVGISITITKRTGTHTFSKNASDINIYPFVSVGGASSYNIVNIPPGMTLVTRTNDYPYLNGYPSNAYTDGGISIYTINLVATNSDGVSLTVGIEYWFYKTTLAKDYHAGEVV